MFQEEGRGWSVVLDWENRCERSCGGMRQRGYQFVEGFLCPISRVKGHVPRVLTLVTSLASSLPGDLGPGVFITALTSQLHPPNTQRKTKHLHPSSPAILRLSTCTNWMHIHTLMHDDPSVDMCLGVKRSEVNTGLAKSWPLCFCILLNMFYYYDFP